METRQTFLLRANTISSIATLRNYPEQSRTPGKKHEATRAQ